jgi:hypothetical protein
MPKPPPHGAEQSAPEEPKNLVVAMMNGKTVLVPADTVVASSPQLTLQEANTKRCSSVLTAVMTKVISENWTGCEEAGDNGTPPTWGVLKVCALGRQMEDSVFKQMVDLQEVHGLCVGAGLRRRFHSP